MADIEAVDHRSRALGDAVRLFAARELLQRENQIRMKAARIDAQESPRIFRLLRMHIEGQPGCNRFLRELRGGKIDCDDGGDTRLRRLRLSDGRVEILPQFAQQMPHRGQNELVLAAEIMMRKRGRNPASCAICATVTSSEPRWPIVRMAASISSRRRKGSIPILGIILVRSQANSSAVYL